MNKERKLILVLGMHRSGTSVLTRALNLLGADVGEHLLPAEQNINAKGYWEHQALVSINEALLTELGRNWYDFRTLPENWWAQPGIEPLMARACEFLNTSFADSSLAVIKDPRLCLLLPFWKAAAAIAGWKPLAVLAMRAPWEVAASLCHRDPLDTVTAHLLWLRYSKEAECRSRDIPRAQVDYAGLLGNWRLVVNYLGRSLKVSWPVSPDDVATEIDAEIDPRMKHQRSRFQGASMSIASLAGQVFHLLRNERLETNKLDEAWKKFEDLLGRCPALETGLAESNSRTVLVNNQLQSLGKKHQKALRVIAEKDRQMERLAGELEQAGEVVTARDQQLGYLAAELDYANKIVAERDQQLQKLAAEFEHADSVVKQRDQQLLELHKLHSHIAIKAAVKLFSLDKK